MDPGIPPSDQKSGQVWSAPPVPRPNGLPALKNAKNIAAYVRRSELTHDYYSDLAFPSKLLRFWKAIDRRAVGSKAA
jgi:hypothetical protein